MRIILSLISNLTEDTCRTSLQPIIVIIRRVITDNPQRKFLVVGDAPRYGHFKVGNTNFYNLALSKSKVNYIISSLIKAEIVLLYRPKLVFTSGVITIIPFALASLFSRSKVVPVLNCEVWYYLQTVPKPISKLLTLLLKQAYSRSKTILCVSEGVKNELIRDFNISPSRIWIYSKRIPAIFSQSVSKELKQELSPGGPLIVSVSRISASKGITYLVEAAKLIVKQFPTAKFVIKGSTGKNASNYEKKYRTEVDRLIQDHGLQGHFIFHDRSDYSEVPKYMAAADVFVLPSITEGIGLVVLEAMAVGAPVVASSVGGIPDIITDGENGLLVRPGDPEGLASAIMRVLADGSLRQRFRERGFEYMEALRKRKDLLEDFINELISKND